MHIRCISLLMLYISYEKWTNRDRQARLVWHLFAADIGSFLCTAESADRRNLVARYRQLRHFK